VESLSASSLSQPRAPDAPAGAPGPPRHDRSARALPNVEIHLAPLNVYEALIGADLTMGDAA
jgi:hypothetical protein